MIAFAFCSYSAALRKKQIALHAQESTGGSGGLQRAGIVIKSSVIAQGHAIVDVDRRL